MVAPAAHVIDAMPGPRSRFAGYGAALAFFNDPIGYLDDLFARYGPLVHVKTPPMGTPAKPLYPGTVFLYGPALLQQVITKHDVYHRVPMSLSLYPVGDIRPRQQTVTSIMTGLPALQKDEHRKHRRLMLPAFQKAAVQTYLQDMTAATQVMLAGWHVGQRIDVSQELLRLTMRISALTLFGQEKAEAGVHIGASVDEWIDFVMSLGHLMPYDLPGFPYRRWLNLSQQIETATRELIADKRAAGASDHSLLSMLIQLRDQDGAPISEADLVGHISLLLWGSRDASVYAITWTLFLLSQHPAILADVVDELAGQLTSGVSSPEQLDQLPLLERVINESLRLLPPFPVLHRVAGQAGELGGYAIPPQTEIVLSLYHTHRQPDPFPDPLSFRPDRWLTLQPGLFDYVPFGVGPRMCIGVSFAMQELKVILALLLLNYRFELIPGTRIDRRLHVTLTPKQGLPMIVCPPDRQFHRGVGGVRGNIREMVKLPE